MTNEELKELVASLAIESKKTDKRIKEAFNLFTTQWGKLIETLVEDDLVKLLRSKNIAVNDTTTNTKTQNYEYDIIAHNGSEVVVVEVKTTLRKDDVDYFLEKLNQIKIDMPRYGNNNILGAVAYLKENESSAKYAERNGLFVIRATGSSASIINKEIFEPKVF